MTDEHWTWLHGPADRPDPRVRDTSASTAAKLSAPSTPHDGRSSYFRPPPLSWESYETQWRAAMPEEATWQPHASTHEDGQSWERS